VAGVTRSGNERELLESRAASSLISPHETSRFQHLVLRRKAQMLFELESSKSIEELDNSLRQAIMDHRFGVLAVHDLKQTLREKGYQFENTCRIYEICNPEQANSVLERNPTFASLLPCRVAIYGTGGKLRLSTVLPTSLFSLIGDQQVASVASKVEEDMKSLMRQAAG
jgi:uncharacterized protein (DUF302 family)